MSSSPNLTTPENIRANAHYHTQPLAEIAEMDYIPATLQQQDEYVADLKVQLGEEKLQQLEQNMEKERKMQESLGDSTTRRLAHKLTGRKVKFKEREKQKDQ
ncbi:hypothetical protein M422DRAFT_55567 [Sphaerobolus stellatus SS14]|uniref:Uncharacterized protein n=1 Tax=Sphaerobolus stellatus (strain SS14) TaxID=990650 RepID=A0A0C9TX39_SPHS4|nr:hypothetical protein M422DRAFT_55567 [Sphaerobolus stellatus SS14]